jgi:hypothetical protein
LCHVTEQRHRSVFPNAPSPTWRRHFLFVENGSDDGTADYLRGQDDVSIWTTQHRLSRFGADWADMAGKCAAIRTPPYRKAHNFRKSTIQSSNLWPVRPMLPIIQILGLDH